MKPTCQRRLLVLSHAVLAACGLWLMQFPAPAWAAELSVGAATTNITPDQPIALDGQFHTRVSKGVDNPITATAVAIEARQNGRAVDQAVLVSCDLVAIRPPLLAAARERLAEKLPEVDARKVIFTATHTHTSGVTEEGRYETPREGVMQPSQFVAFLADRLEELIGDAWKQRRPGGVSWGLGHAVVGYNRRAVYADGSAAMYAKTDRADFRGMEGYEDHGLEMLFFWNDARQPVVPKNSIRRLYPPTGHTPNWVTSEKMGTKRPGLPCGSAVSPSHADRQRRTTRASLFCCDHAARVYR